MARLVPEEGGAHDVDGGQAAPGQALPLQRLYPEVQDRALEGHHMLCVNLRSSIQVLQRCDARRSNARNLSK